MNLPLALIIILLFAIIIIAALGFLVPVKYKNPSPAIPFQIPMTPITSDQKEKFKTLLQTLQTENKTAIIP